MKLALIVPFKHMRLAKKGDIDFMLIKEAQENEHYREYFKRQVKIGREVYADWNIHENERDVIDFDKAMDMILKEKICTTMIAPDSMFHFRPTVKATNDFLNKYYLKLKRRKIDVMAVVQGKNLVETLECFEIFNKDKRISRIGLAFDYNFATPDTEVYSNQMQSRMFFLYKIAKLNKIKKKIHCLGSNGILEIKYASLFPFVYSLDTKLFSRIALANIRLNDNNWHGITKPKERMEFTTEFQDKQVRIFSENIKFIKSLIK